MRKSWLGFAIAVMLVIAASLACSLPALPVSTTAPTPALLATPTAAPPQVTSLPPAGPANELEAQVETVYDRAAPAVVNITSRSVAYDFFMRPVPQEGTGSGFIYDADGHIVTNYHVVENSESISVALPNGEVYDAEVVGTDPSNDLAVLHIEAQGLPDPIPLGDSDQLRVGQFVLAIGSPFRQQGTLTLGVISALGRVIESPDGRFIGEAIQTDAAVNPGNSGGPLLDLQGRVIGLNSQIISPSRANAGIGFAVSANTIRRVVPQLIAHGHYPHPWIGISTVSFDANSVQLLRNAGIDTPVDEGLLVVEVVENSPAAEAGIHGATQEVLVGNTRVPVGGDILVAVNDTPVTSFKDLTVYLETETQVGDTVDLTIIRDGEEMTVPLTLAGRPTR